MKESCKKEVFFVAVTDEQDTKNRKYSDSIRSLCQSAINENRNDNVQYEVKRHEVKSSNSKQSLFEQIAKSTNFIILLDQYENGFNPNVWFELGVISTIPDIKLMCIAKQDTPTPFDVGSEVTIIRISDALLKILETKFNQTNFNADSAFDEDTSEILNFKKEIRKNL